MVDYSKLSDFEINKRIALALGFDLYKDGKSCQKNHVAIQEGRSGAFTMDWCNNPADAWPIIDENNITIINDHPEIRYAVNNLNAYRNGDNNNIVKSDSNGLRAGMIVFLKMQDAKNG